MAEYKHVGYDLSVPGPVVPLHLYDEAMNQIRLANVLATALLVYRMTVEIDPLSSDAALRLDDALKAYMRCW